MKRIAVLAGVVLVAGQAALAEGPASPEAGGPRYLAVTGVTGGLNLREAPSASAAVLVKLAPGTLLVNLGGCQQAEGRDWCDVQPLGGGARGYVAGQYVAPGRGPNGDVPTGYDDSAQRAGEGKFDATTVVACAKGAGAPMGSCDAAVARGTGGDATVVISLPGGGKRMIMFMAGQAVGGDGSQADGMAGAEFRAERQSDLTLITYGDERYEIVDAIPLGG